MKILIMVLSYMEPPYDELLRAQQETWDSIEVGGVRTVYYYGGGKGWVNEKEFSANASDEYYYMTNKCLETLKEVLKNDRPDYIWRTNSSSYICKSRLVEFCKTLPKEGCYCGWELKGHTCSVVSGAGFVITPDVAELLIQNADPVFCREEDCYIAEVLFGQGVKIIDDKSRYDVPEHFDEVPADRYHYRLKCGARREVDVENMKKLHAMLNV